MSRRPKFTPMVEMSAQWYRAKKGVSAASICRVWRVYSMQFDTFIVAVKLDVGDRIPHDAKRKLDYHISRLNLLLTIHLRAGECDAFTAAERISYAWQAIMAYASFFNASSDKRSFAALSNLSYADDLLRYAVGSYFKKRMSK